MDDVSTADVARPRRVGQTVSDMARSLGLMAAVIVALLFLGPARALIFPGADRLAPVDYSLEVTKFTTGSGLPAITPSALPASWRANAARLSVSARLGEHLHIGWAVPGSRFAGLDEATGDPTLLLRSVLGAPAGTVVGQQVIDGAPWDVRRSARGEQALTHNFGSVLVVVTGSATGRQLTLLATSLG